MRVSGWSASRLVTVVLLAASPTVVDAETSASCPTWDTALASVCESFCDHLACVDDPSDEACMALADAFQVRTGDLLSCAVQP